MPQFIKIRGAYFNNDSLPVLTDLGAAIAALPGLAGWVNANENNYYTDGGGHLALRDLSSAGADFVRGVGNTRDASVVENVLNGYPVLRFVGASSDRDGFQRAISDVPTGPSAEFSFAVVVRATDVAGNRNIIATASSASGATLYSVTSGSSAQIGLRGVSASSPLGASSWKILVCSVSNGLTVKILNASDLTTIATNTAADENTSAALYLGQNNTSSGFFGGDIAEAIYTESDLLDASNAAHLAKLINYFQTKFGL